MSNFRWQHITYLSGGNPYICKTKKELGKLKKKYGDRMFPSHTENFWYVDDIEKGGDNFC